MLVVHVSPFCISGCFPAAMLGRSAGRDIGGDLNLCGRLTAAGHSCRGANGAGRRWVQLGPLPNAIIRAGHNACPGGLWNDQLVGPTVLIVDDHETFRASARALLEAEGFDVVGEAADGAEAVAAVP